MNKKQIKPILIGMVDWNEKFLQENSSECQTNITDYNHSNSFPTTNNIGYPQGRVIADANGNKTAVSSSEYAKYAHFYLPAENYWGDVVGILGFYYDNGLKYSQYPPAADDWSISIRSVDDLRLYDGDEHWLYDENGDYKPGYEYSKK